MGAIIGALAGVCTGVGGIPPEWIRGVTDWPRGTALLMELGPRIAAVAGSRRPGRPVGYFWPAVVARNVVFLALALAHGLGRLLPPIDRTRGASQRPRVVLEWRPLEPTQPWTKQ